MFALLAGNTRCVSVWRIFGVVWCAVWHSPRQDGPLYWGKYCFSVYCQLTRQSPWLDQLAAREKYWFSWFMIHSPASLLDFTDWLQWASVDSLGLWSIIQVLWFDRMAVRRQLGSKDSRSAACLPTGSWGKTLGAWLGNSTQVSSCWHTCCCVFQG